MSQNDGRALHLLDDVGNSERLARAGHPQQGLVRQAGLQSVHQFPDRFRLIAGGLIGGVDAKHALSGGAGFFAGHKRSDYLRDLAGNGHQPGQYHGNI